MTQQRSFLTASALKQLQAASGSVEAFASRLVAVSVLVHDMLRLPSGKRCPPWWPKLVAASAPQLPSGRCPAASIASFS
ncbi:hypothetical protein PF004_g29783 [Phytophthora fragariae]|uniref:Uncharacterized protein n=1 Tax=Phytophthora fragariae TaxID=53985 RepID=A0A6G0ME42_9STRA|nr:hypothetical protein PF004_g29783 [Phytophthora fragariae]